MRSAGGFMRRMALCAVLIACGGSPESARLSVGGSYPTTVAGSYASSSSSTGAFAPPAFFAASFAFSAASASSSACGRGSMV